MSRMSLTAALLSAVLLFGASPVQTKEKEPKGPPPENVNITTADGVLLKAKFYKGGDGAATVIMLHPIGDGKSMNTPEWKDLAEKLRDAKYSVLMFDFRGHGDSTTIDDEKLFWNNAVNRMYVKPKDPKVKSEIDVKDYLKNAKAYMPVLINDIAAVRAYLDRRNDKPGDCNTSSLIVIGADTGATLGGIWINSEWYRYKFTPNPMNFPAVEIKNQNNYTNPAGKDIIGAVFLSIQPKLEGRAIGNSKVLSIACNGNGMAALFMHNTEEKSFNDTLAANLKKKGGAKHEFIGAYELSTKLSGVKMLQRGLKTDELIVTYLDSFMEKRKVERVERDFPNTNYRWRWPTGVSAPARETVPPNPVNLKKGEKNLLWDDYNRFIPQ